MASSFLENQNWVLQVLKTHDPDSNFRIANKIQAITPELKERANLLQRQMEQRLVCHCQSRIVDEKKRSHWCLEWGAQNFPQVAAIMCLFGQAKSDLSCLDSNQCLLAGVNAFLKSKNNAAAALEGSCLHWDCNNQEWIRSGKAVGSNFNKRNTQHANGAKLTTTASQMRNISFY